MPIGGTRCYFIASRRPSASQQILLKIVLMALEYLHTSFPGCIRSHVPHPQGVIHGICQDKVSFGGQGHSGNRIRMPSQMVQDSLFSNVPDFDFVVDPAANYLFSSVTKTNSCDLKRGFQSVCRVFFPGVPDFYGAIIASRAEELLTPTRALNAVHEVAMPLEPPLPLARGYVPKGQSFISGAGKNVRSIRRKELP